MPKDFLLSPKNSSLGIPSKLGPPLFLFKFKYRAENAFLSFASKLHSKVLLSLLHQKVKL